MTARKPAPKRARKPGPKPIDAEIRRAARAWRTSTNPETMAEEYGERFTERKARLIMLECCLRHPKYLTAPAVRTMVDLLVGHYADPRKPDEPFNSAAARKHYKALDAYASVQTTGPVRGVAFGVVAAAEPASVMKRLEETFRYLVFSCTHDIAAGFGSHTRPRRQERAAQADLIREVLGNPHDPVVFDPAWRTDTAVALARQAHETEDFTLLPILADALQDAGCEDETILGHCRDPEQLHVRGCWVIDLVLGKA